MPSRAYRDWMTTRAKALDEIEAAHASVGGTGRGRRYATQQINQAYAVLVASQFQGFCRDLHTESATRLVDEVIKPHVVIRDVVQTRFTQGRQLDSKNAQPSSLGSDFNRFGIKFWDEVYTHDPENRGRSKSLDKLNDWRNAIAHQDFEVVGRDGSVRLKLAQVRRWRSVCRRLARSFDEVMMAYVQSLIETR